MAFTLVGAGAANAAESPAPATPMNLAGVGGDASIAVLFVQPAPDEGQAPAASWEYSTDDATTWSAFAPPLAGGEGVRTAVITLQSGPQAQPLENETEYKVKVRAVAATGDTSGAPTAVRVTPVGPGPVPPKPVAPDAPQVVATPGDGEASFAWTTKLNGGELVTYQIRTSIPAESEWEDVQGEGPLGKYSWTGIENGTSYTLEVRAVTLSAGEEVTGPIGSATVVPGVKPLTPVIDTVTRSADGTSVAVEFTQPPLKGGELPLSYMYSINGGQAGTWFAFNPQITESPGVISGLSPSAILGLKIMAMNERGSSDHSNLVVVKPGSVNPPTGLQAGTGNQSLAISFTEPDDLGDLELVGYQYQLNGGDWVDAPVAGTQFFLIQGLPNGVPVTVTMRTVAKADDVQYVSAASEGVTATPSTQPGAPTNLGVVPGDKSGILTFTPPADGSSAILNYEYSTDAGTTWMAFDPAVQGPPVTIDATSVDGEPLVNGKPYDVALRAVNANGPGPSSAPIVLTPVAVPAAPTPLPPAVLDPQPAEDSVPVVANAVINFEPPTNIDPAEVKKYQVQLGGSGPWLDCSQVKPVAGSLNCLWDGATSLGLVGIEIGSTLTYSLRAVTADAIGQAAAPESQLVAVLPSKPLDVEVAGMDGAAQVNWRDYGTEPFDPIYFDGGSSVLRFEYTDADPNAPFTLWYPFTPSVTASPGMITGLENGVTYEGYFMRAVTAVGASVAVKIPAFTPVPPAPTPAISAPTNLVATPQDGAAVITFTPGLPENGAEVSNYEYQLDGGAWVAFNPFRTTSPVEIDGLTNSQTYSINLRAVGTAAGEAVVGAVSDPVSVMPRGGEPDAPSELVGEAGDGQAVISFVAGSDAGSPITNYEYQLDGGEWVAFDPAVTESPVTVAGLTNGQEYSIALRAVNEVGPSAASAPVMVTPVTVPNAPSELVGEAGDGQAVISFVAGGDGGSPITNFEYQLDGGEWVAFDPAVTESPVTVAGLTNGQEYSIALRAVNEVGPSADSAPVMVTPVDPKPDAPVALVGTAGYTTAMVTFEFGPNTDPEGVTDVEYSTDGGVTWVSTGSADPMVNLGGLPNGVPVNLQVRAVNAAGIGQASDPVEVTPLGAVFMAIDPERAYDSRTAGGAISGGQSRVVDLGGTAIPADALAVAYNVTVTGTTGSGLLTVTPGDAATGGDSSTINWMASNMTLANAFQVGVDGDQQVKVFAQGGSTQFVVDVMGYYVAQDDAASTMTAITPERAYDSRVAGGAVAGGSSRVVDVTTAGGVPADATAVAYTVTVTGTVGGGYLAVAPAGDGEPEVSTINWTASNTTLANSAVVGVNGGEIEVFAGGDASRSTQFIIDVIGYFTEGDEGARFTAIAPARSYDSRVTGGPLAGGAQRTTTMSVAGVPADIEAVAYNLTVAGTTGSGFLSVNPAGTAQATASTINWMTTGTTLANGSVVGTADTRVLDDAVTTFAGGGSTQYLTDVAGYYN